MNTFYIQDVDRYTVLFISGAVMTLFLLHGRATARITQGASGFSCSTRIFAIPFS